MGYGSGFKAQYNNVSNNPNYGREQMGRRESGSAMGIARAKQNLAARAVAANKKRRKNYTNKIIKAMG